MAEHTINLDEATETLVKTAAGRVSVDLFISNAAKREAELRIEAGRELARMADEAEASGSSGLTLDEMDEHLGQVIQRVRDKNA